MRISVITEARCQRLPDGSVWSSVPCAFWSNYLAVFEQVNVVARVQPAPQPRPGSVRSDGGGVCFSGIRHYHGLWDYLRKYPQVVGTARRAVDAADAVILRVPSQVATLVRRHLQGTRPYGVEVVGDAFQVFAPGVVRRPLRPFLRVLATRNQKRQCLEAAAAAYVTRQTLQTRYPCVGPQWGVSDVLSLPSEPFITHYSSVDLPDLPTRARDKGTQPTRALVCVGSLEQLYKGPDVLLEALHICGQRGLDYSLTWVGDGSFRNKMIARAASLGLSARVRFVGAVEPGREVARCLDAADLFVLPSRTEGLPRALIEALARGLPCLASRVGGVPELLHPDDLVPPGDARALAEKLETVLSDNARLAEMGRRNVQTALEFDAESIERRRRAFYRHVRDVTKAWLENRRA